MTFEEHIKEYLLELLFPNGVPTQYDDTDLQTRVSNLENSNSFYLETEN